MQIKFGAVTLAPSVAQLLPAAESAALKASIENEGPVRETIAFLGERNIHFNLSAGETFESLRAQREAFYTFGPIPSTGSCLRIDVVNAEGSRVMPPVIGDGKESTLKSSLLHAISDLLNIARARGQRLQTVMPQPEGTDEH